MSAIRGFRVNWDILYHFGVWTKSDETKLSKIRHLLLNSLIILMFYVFQAQIKDIVDSTSDITKMCFNLCLSALVFMFIVRFIFFKLKKNEFKEFVSNCEKYYAQRSADGAYDLKLFEHRAMFVERYIKLISPFVASASIGIMVVPLLEGEVNVFPVPGRYAELFYKSPYYELWYCTLFCLASWVTPTIAFSEFLIAGFMFQLMTQYDVLINKINNSEALSTCRLVPGVPLQKLLTEEVRVIVREHQYILSQIKLLNSIYAMNALINAITVVVLLCGLGYSFVIAHTEVGVLTIAEASYAVVVLVDISIQCLISQQLENKSLDLADAMWASNWLLMDRSTQANVRIIISKAQTPVLITLGKFGSVTNLTLVMILKSTFNLLALFREIAVMDK